MLRDLFLTMLGRDVPGEQILEAELGKLIAEKVEVLAARGEDMMIEDIEGCNSAITSKVFLASLAQHHHLTEFTDPIGADHGGKEAVIEAANCVPKHVAKLYDEEKVEEANEWIALVFGIVIENALVVIREYRKMKDIIGELEALVEAVPA